jgi:CRP-like cAMP-binding protein
LFGDICLFDSHKRTASVVAVTNVRVLEIKSSELSHYLDEHPAFGYQFLKELFKIMVDRLELANNRIENLLAWGLKVHDINKYL